MEKTTIEKYKDRGLTGLTNVGNTCYLNSCVQILSHTYELNEFLDEETYKTKLNKKPDSVLIIEWDKLRKRKWETIKKELDICVLLCSNCHRLAHKEMREHAIL